MGGEVSGLESDMVVRSLGGELSVCFGVAGVAKVVVVYAS